MRRYGTKRSGGALVGLAVILLANAAQAAKHPMPDVADFTVGVSTANDVIDRYGRPNMDDRNSDGTRKITYYRIKAHMKGATYIPVVGLFAGGAKGTSESVAFTFGPDGKLKATSTGTTETECGTLSGCH